MKTVFLFDNTGLTHEPKWWTEFAKGQILNSENVNEVLKEHNVRYRFENANWGRYLDFETEDDYIMFLLKFS